MNEKKNNFLEIRESKENTIAFADGINRAIEKRIKPLLTQPILETLRKPKADKGV